MLATLAIVPVAGCLVEDGEEPSEPASTDERDNETTGPAGDETAQGSTVEDLPEPSPLASVLVDLVSAGDREAFLSNHDLETRDGAVRVEISLVEGGEPPAQYLPEDRTEYQNTAIAYVDIDNLVALALAEDVRFVAPRIEPQREGRAGP